MAVDDDRRAIYLRITHTAVTRDITRFVRLRFAGKRCDEMLAPYLVIVSMCTFNEMMANDFVKLIAGHLKHCLVAPFVVPVGIERINRFARTFQDILQQRLAFAGHCFCLA